jgi:hypothetical protein
MGRQMVEHRSGQGRATDGEQRHETAGRRRFPAPSPQAGDDTGPDDRHRADGHAVGVAQDSGT